MTVTPPPLVPPPSRGPEEQAPRVWAISDIHTDIKQNRTWLYALSNTAYLRDTLILAGDISDRLEILRDTLVHLRSRFAAVCYVPGNHELWVRKREYPDSIAKFWQIRHLCETLGIHTEPFKLSAASSRSVWIVPLFSWYMQPEEGTGSLFVEKPGEDPTLSMWSDHHFTSWPSMAAPTVAEFFLTLNERHLSRHYDAPVISFSHFLPRTELIYSTPAERQGRILTDPYPQFNFSRVAGCTGIDAQVRRLGAIIHIYGHQHRNRNRLIDGVRYISHCLGYPRERQHSSADQVVKPALIYDLSGIQKQAENS
ncbi:metallophosphoesterase family protein [Candidatus Entotheonella palauensis]|uniref:metallophosphoesterase family protein n=1 Tax=Candidatus Entotheonella palauensis TaxID=93172 RepID=UPI000B7F2F05|nr:metallophosphoesterase [Candidatus Entotheonella palauensis]